MIHRDLKPANLMLVGRRARATTRRPAVKILDIGLGKAVFDEGAKSPAMTVATDRRRDADRHARLPGARSRPATPSTADIRADIYTLGCVLYQRLTGQPPFPDKSVLNTVMRHATEPPRPLSDFLPRRAGRAAERDELDAGQGPDQRYATPERAAQALNLFLRNTPPAKPATARYRTTSNGWRIPARRDQADPALPANIPIGRLEPTGRRPDAVARLTNPVHSSRAAATPPPSAAAGRRGRAADIDVELVSVPICRPRRTSRAAGTEPPRRRSCSVAGGAMVLGAILVG